MLQRGSKFLHFGVNFYRTFICKTLIFRQEIIICLGSLVRTDPNLFIEMLRLRIGLIIQVLASELSRIRKLSGAEALEQLLCVSPFELKRMLFSLLSGRLLEDVGIDEEVGVKEVRTGMGSFRKQIEERKVCKNLKNLI